MTQEMDVGFDSITDLHFGGRLLSVSDAPYSDPFAKGVIDSVHYHNENRRISMFVSADGKDPNTHKDHPERFTALTPGSVIYVRLTQDDSVVPAAGPQFALGYHGTDQPGFNDPIERLYLEHEGRPGWWVPA